MEYYDVDDVLRELTLDEEDLKRLVSEGELRAYRQEGRMVFRRADVEEFRGRGADVPAADLETSVPDLDFAVEDAPTAAFGLEDLMVEEDVAVPSSAAVEDPDPTGGPLEIVEGPATAADGEPPPPPDPGDARGPHTDEGALPVPPSRWAPWALASAALVLAGIGWLLADLARLETLTHPGRPTSVSDWMRGAIGLERTLAE